MFCGSRLSDIDFIDEAVVQCYDAPVLKILL